MRVLLITAAAAIIAAAGMVGWLAMSPAPDTSNAITLVIETGSISTASTRASSDRLGSASRPMPETSADGETSDRAEKTLDEVIAARLADARRADQGERAGSDRQAEWLRDERAGAPDPGVAAAPAQPEVPQDGFPVGAVDEAPAAISITQMLAAELSGDSGAREPQAAAAAGPPEPATPADPSPIQDSAGERGAAEDAVPAAPSVQTRSGEAPAASRPAPAEPAEPAERPFEIAALEPGPDADRAIAGAREAETSAPAADAPPAPISQPGTDTRLPLAAGLAPPPPLPRGDVRLRGRIALIIRGLGVNADLTARTIETMPRQVALGFVPYGEGLADWTRRARARRHEVLLQIPLEPANYPDTNPGPHTLLTSASIDENLERLDWLLDRFSGISGVTNFLGGKFASVPGALAPVLMELKARGLLYVDDGDAADATAEQLARQVSLGYAVADKVIDKDRSPDAIAKALSELEVKAEAEGAVIAIGHAHGATLDALADWIGSLEGKGFALSPVHRVLVPERRVSRSSGG